MATKKTAPSQEEVVTEEKEAVFEEAPAEEKASGFIELRRGSFGKRVEEVQRALRAVKPRIGVDGVFDPSTALAVKAFQAENNLSVTGVVDKKTWKALGL